MIQIATLILFALASTLVHAEPPAVPAPQSIDAQSPYRCEAAYKLVPGERRVLACQFKPTNMLGVAAVQSRHASVDASIVSVAPLAVVFVLSNRSSAAVSAVAVIDRL